MTLDTVSAIQGLIVIVITPVFLFPYLPFCCPFLPPQFLLQQVHPSPQFYPQPSLYHTPLVNSLVFQVPSLTPLLVILQSGALIPHLRLFCPFPLQCVTILSNLKCPRLHSSSPLNWTLFLYAFMILSF